MEKEKIDIFRSEECIRRYKERTEKMGGTVRNADLTKLPFVDKWKFWILVKNEFPYDRIAEEHCLLVPFRQFAEDEEMNGSERKELFTIKKWFATQRMFDLLTESIPHNRSVPTVYHLHCMKLKYRTPLSVYGGLDK